MHAYQKDLWGDLTIQEGPMPPIVILREQANLLDQKTKNILRGEIISIVPEYEAEENKFQQIDKIIHQFMIIVPALKNYRYELFSVSHSINQAYPASFHMPENFSEKEIRAHSETEFEHTLADILSSSYTKNIIQNLLIQTKE